MRVQRELAHSSSGRLGRWMRVMPKRSASILCALPRYLMECSACAASLNSVCRCTHRSAAVTAVCPSPCEWRRLVHPQHLEWLGEALTPTSRVLPTGGRGANAGDAESFNCQPERTSVTLCTSRPLVVPVPTPPTCLSSRKPANGCFARRG